MVSMPHYEPYLLVMSGTSQNAPFLASWKDLKDHVRTIIKNPGWTGVHDVSDSDRSQGWCNIRREDQAKAAYGMCTIAHASYGP
ncbi:hypothetical protein EK21DRAFT_77829 [Setomelanomma holmii]|uniref:Uncharacterized protein n=1 Tax=Setomelanomma holmii TaxID=210430 RepID=A0A9P4LH40_9PLEO|nr:hypothetical protein EK21DRAFT_77829 [Setomelanomma holmii]